MSIPFEQGTFLIRGTISRKRSRRKKEKEGGVKKCSGKK